MTLRTVAAGVGARPHFLNVNVNVTLLWLVNALCPIHDDESLNAKVIRQLTIHFARGTVRPAKVGEAVKIFSYVALNLNLLSLK